MVIRSGPLSLETALRLLVALGTAAWPLPAASLVPVSRPPDTLACSLLDGPVLHLLFPPLGPSDASLLKSQLECPLLRWPPQTCWPGASLCAPPHVPVVACEPCVPSDALLVLVELCPPWERAGVASVSRPVCSRCHDQSQACGRHPVG